MLADPAVRRVADKLTIDQAIFAKECGVSFADCRVDLYNDDELVSADEGFGSGAVNTVAKLVHQDGTERVFKPEQSTDEKPPLVTKTLGHRPECAALRQPQHRQPRRLRRARARRDARRRPSRCTTARSAC